MKKRSIQQIGLLSICHAGIDFLCAFSLYHSFSFYPNVFLLYNFMAFALQLPLGILLDLFCRNKQKTFFPGFFFTAAGVFLTIGGAFLSPLILGLGNALFHVGGGVLTIQEDNDAGMKGKGLGVFVAPGAIGLCLGSLFYASSLYHLILLIVSILLLVVLCFLYYGGDKERSQKEAVTTIDKETAYLLLLCFVVVVLRSLGGMAISFSWKDTSLKVFISVLALAFGKTAGGFLGARSGIKKTVVVSLLLSSFFYIFADHFLFGLLSLFFFNMTMPLTLYLLSDRFPGMPGFAFGTLTFALFIGYLPVLYGYLRNLPPFPMGTIVSLISLVLLYAAVKPGKKEYDE